MFKRQKRLEGLEAFELNQTLIAASIARHETSCTRRNRVRCKQHVGELDGRKICDATQKANVQTSLYTPRNKLCKALENKVLLHLENNAKTPLPAGHSK